MTEGAYWYWLCNMEGLGIKRLSLLLEHFSTPERVYEASEGELQKVAGIGEKSAAYIIESRRGEWEKKHEKMEAANIRMIPWASQDYPQKLKEIEDKPVCLYVKGRLPDIEKKAAAIVGARNCSYYGRETAAELGRVLGRNGVEVISGMARGIDAAGQWGALDGGGESFAVLGCGVDVCYPPEQGKLYRLLQSRGGLLSEYPMGMPPHAANFPPRNRIISAMADIVVVVEARERSGSLITVDFALNQGKEIFAVPGRLTDALSRGCNELIKHGAGIVTAPETLLEELGIFFDNFSKNNKTNKILLAEKENMLYSGLDLTPKNIQMLATETGLSLAETTECLLDLQLKGLVLEPYRNYYVKKDL